MIVDVLSVNLKGLFHELRLAERATDSSTRIAHLRNALGSANQVEAVSGVIAQMIRITLAGPGSVASNVPEAVAIGNDADGFFGSGVLLTQDRLLTSAHCSDATKVFYGSMITGEPVPGAIGTLTLIDTSNLLAIFEVRDISASPSITLPGDKFAVKAGDVLRAIAFGNTGAVGGFGSKREAPFTVEEILKFRIRASSDSAVCPGDSGGPAFLNEHFDDGDRLLLALCDSSSTDDCASGGVFANLVGQLEWIRDTGDLTVTDLGNERYKVSRLPVRRNQRPQSRA